MKAAAEDEAAGAQTQSATRMEERVQAAVLAEREEVAETVKPEARETPGRTEQGAMVVAAALPARMALAMTFTRALAKAAWAETERRPATLERTDTSTCAGRHLRLRAWPKHWSIWAQSWRPWSVSYSFVGRFTCRSGELCSGRLCEAQLRATSPIIEDVLRGRAKAECR